MSREEIEARKEEMRPWYWWGVPTFFRCDWNEKPEDCDIGLVGVPHSTGNGSTERDQHLGPRSIRHVSARLRRAHQAFGLTPWEAVVINDLGDVPLPEANNNEISVVHIQDYYEILDEVGTRPVCRRPEVVIGSFRCPSGRLRTQVALVGGKAVGGALGRVHGARRSRGCRAQYSNRHSRQSK